MRIVKYFLCLTVGMTWISINVTILIYQTDQSSKFGSNNTYKVKVKVKVTLRPTVSRPVCLGVRRPSGTRDQFLFLLEILFRQLQVCYFVALSLTRGRVCNLLLLLVLASAVPLGSAFSDEKSGLSFVSISL
jgi:hypothetical protein